MVDALLYFVSLTAVGGLLGLLLITTPVLRVAIIV